jgi:hypothetical protein
LLSKQEQAGAGQRALRDFGLSLIMAGAAPGGGKQAPSFLAALAGGTKAGEASYEDFAARTRAARSQMEMKDILAGGPTPEALSEAYGSALASGDLETARTIGPVLQSLISQQGGTIPNLMKHELENGTVAFFNPKTGEHVTSYSPPLGEAADITPEDMRIIGSAYDRFDTTTKLLREIPLQVRRVFAPTNRMIASFSDPNVTEAQKKELAFAAVTGLSAYARTIDPGSVVRSEEMRLLLGQGDLFEKLETLIQRMTTGRMSVDIARALQAEARAQLMAQAPVFQSELDLAKERLTDFGYDPKHFSFPDPFTPLINELFDADGNPRVTNTIGIPQGTPQAGAARVQQFITPGG